MRAFRHLWLAATTVVTVAVLVATAVWLPGRAPDLALTAASAAAAAADDPAAGPTDVLPPDEQWTVTLLTGDRVGVVSDAEGRLQARVEGRGRGPIDVLREPDGDIYVLPAEALPLLSGTLDRELFNVVGLIRQGYDDASTPALPLIIEHPVDAGLVARSGPAPERLASIDATAVEVPKGGKEAAELLRGTPPGAAARGGASMRISLDRRLSVRTALDTRAPAAAVGPAQAPELDWNLRAIGADAAWAAGLGGEGVRVAVLDTGIDAAHPDIAGQIVAVQNFSSSPDTVDRYGHGTHVAATIAGTGAGAPGARSGVAPRADLVIGKVMGDDGFGSESDIIAGMEWAAPQAEVVNMSLGSPYPSDGSDPLSQAVDQLTEQHGTLFVLSAGNSGPMSQTIGSPAASDAALTVGAVDRDDALAEFSSRGPLVSNYRMKPEIVAPGVDVVAARAAGTAMGSPQGPLYTRASGTSMAAPHVAGAAALVAQQHPDWSAAQIEAALVGTVDPLDDDGFDVGAGRLDVGATAASELRSDQDTVDVTLPHPRTTPADHTLSWTNTGAVAVTVTLAAELEDREGTAVAAATVTPTQLTVEPGATGTATLRIDPGLDDGLYSGAVVARVEGEQPIRTPVGVHAAPPLVDLTLESTPPPGGPGQDAPYLYYVVTNLDDYAEFNYWDASGDLRPTLRVPAGRYAVVGTVHGGDWDNPTSAQVGDPDVVVDGDTVVPLDGSATELLAPRVEGVATAPPLYDEASVISTPAAGAGGQSVVMDTYSYYPAEPIRLTRMSGAADVFAARQVFRLQAPPLTARVGAGGAALDVVPVLPRTPTAGRTTLTAVDAGDGKDLSGTAGRLAVVQLPLEQITFPWDPTERAAITQRAAEAGTAMIVFVDAARHHLAPRVTEGWSDVPVIGAGGSVATALKEAGAAGASVTIDVTASPFVYDIVRQGSEAVDPAPVISRREQRGLARLNERFHRDADGTGPEYDTRGPSSLTLFGYLQTAGPLPQRRTAYVTPDVAWQSGVVGRYLGEPWGDRMIVGGTLSMNSGVVYEPGSRQGLRFLRRPQWPGPVATAFRDPFCPAWPSLRTSDEILVHLVPFQDDVGRLTCGDALDERLSLTQDGVPVGSEDYNSGRFTVQPGASTFQLAYEQNGQAPFVHRSTTTWTFRSAEPAGDAELLPLLTADYQLPLDTLNRPTGRTAVVKVEHLDPEAPDRIKHFQVWTSQDQGATWQPARVTRLTGKKFEVRLPELPAGTAVSLRVDATDKFGSRIEQTLIDAYTA